MGRTNTSYLVLALLAWLIPEPQDGQDYPPIGTMPAEPSSE